MKAMVKILNETFMQMLINYSLIFITWNPVRIWHILGNNNRSEVNYLGSDSNYNITLIFFFIDNKINLQHHGLVLCLHICCSMLGHIDKIQLG